MRRFSALLLLAACCGAHAAATVADTCAAHATAMVDAWERGDTVAARADMNGFMKMMYSDDQLTQSREAMEHQYGQYQSRGDAVSQPNGKTVLLIRIPLHYSGGTPTATFNCDLQDHASLASFAVLRPGE